MDNPLKTKFRYGSSEHSKLARALAARLNLSYNKMSDRYQKMSENEKQYNAYVKLDDKNASRKRGKEEGSQDFYTIEVPYSYAALMTAHTYYTSVFLSRNPIMQFAGRHGEGENKVQALEAMMNYQMTVGQNLAQMFVWLLDPGKYGYGVLGHYWDVETISRTHWDKTPATYLNTPIAGAKPTWTSRVEEARGYQGNRLYNVRPQDFLPDTRVALMNFQSGEFCSRYVEIAWNEFLVKSRAGIFFNHEQVKNEAKNRSNMHGNNGITISREEGDSSNLGGLPDQETYDTMDLGPSCVKGYEMYVRLRPNEWGFDTSTDSQQIWVLNITCGGVVFGIQPMNSWSNQFPFSVLPTEPEGYYLFTPSLLERVKPFNDTISWLLNSHFYNVRAAVNNQFIVDESRVVLKDVQNPAAGKLIRLKPEAFGTDVRTVLSQLPVADVTRNNISDLQIMEQVIQRTLGINDNVMGMVNSGGRKTATEIRTSTSHSINRLKTQCEWFSAIGFSPLAQSLVQATQENYDTEMELRIVGDLSRFSSSPVTTVNPEMLAGYFDFEAVDGTLPVDRFAQANLWQQMFGQIRNFPQIMAQYDMVGIFGWVASLAGLKNVGQFRIQATDPAQLQNSVQAGNSVPLAGMRTNPNEPGQIPGMGATG